MNSSILSDKRVKKTSNYRCCLCKTNDGSRSYFKFPIEDKLNARWTSFCDLPRFSIYKNSTLCSNHFELDCIINCKGRRLKLRKGAVPTINHPKKKDIPIKFEFVEVQRSSTFGESIENNDSSLSITEFNEAFPSTSSSHTNAHFPNETKVVKKIEVNEAQFLSPSHDTDYGGTVVNEIWLCDTECSSSSHAANGTPEFRVPQYLGGVRNSHLSTPRGAEACFDMAKQLVFKKNKQIKSLKQQNQRLKTRIKYLKELLLHFRRENRISEIAFI